MPESGTRLNPTTDFLEQRLQRPSPQITGVWVDGAIATNPTAGDILADTGALTVGEYVFAFLLVAMGLTSSGRLRIEHRNAANAANLAAQTFPIGADSVLEPVFPTKISIVEGERIRVLAGTSITGDVEVSILYARLVG